MIKYDDLNEQREAVGRASQLWLVMGESWVWACQKHLLFAWTRNFILIVG